MSEYDEVATLQQWTAQCMAGHEADRRDDPRSAQYDNPLRQMIDLIIAEERAAITKARGEG